MEHKLKEHLAARRHKMRKREFLFAPFVPLCGNPQSQE
jgi:hypothetical protein